MRNFTQVAEKVNNWGRWGADDERGTLNFVTPDVVKAAMGSVRSGRSFALAIPLSSDGPQIGMIPGRINPLKTMLAINDPMTGNIDEFCTSDDSVVMGLQAGTHWDSLAHATYSNRIYNGAPIASLTTRGAAKCGIDKVGPLVSRGVLLDVARAKGVERLDPGYALTAGRSRRRGRPGQGHRALGRHRARAHRSDPAAACRRQDGLHLPVARLLDADGSRGCTRTRSPPSPTTPSSSRSSPANTRICRCRCTCCTWSRWA